MQKISYYLDKSTKIPFYEQLYQQIKSAIHRKALQLGDKLPSKRKLSQHLQISQNTVENAYAQLIAEGYIESDARRGFYVCFQSDLRLFRPIIHAQKKTSIRPLAQALIDFNPNAIDTQYFPFQQWKKSGQHIFQSEQHSFLALGDPQGDLYLREQIASYLSAARGIDCQSEQIILGAGVEYCIQILMLLFNQCYPQTHFCYGMENFGYPKVQHLLQLYHQKIVKLPLNQYHQLDLAFLFQQPINVAYVTPSNVYPFGEIIPISQRQSLLEWANKATHRFIIEDDYDSEFRYKGKPIPALKSLDSQNKVIYLGSFSKLLMPSLRLTFMVLPPTLLACYQQIKHCFHCPISRFEQQRLAYFMQEGYFEKHLHRMRKIYRKKMEILCQLLAPYQHKIRYYGEHSGFYLLIEVLNEKRACDTLIELAQREHIQIYPIDSAVKRLFILGFGDLNEERLKQGITTLLYAWGIEKSQ